MTFCKFTFSLQIGARSMKHFIHVPLVLREVENQIFPSSTLLPLMDYAPEAQEMLKSFKSRLIRDMVEASFIAAASLHM